MRISETWGTFRWIVREGFTFTQIKDLAGLSGLPVQQLARLRQTSSHDSATKGEKGLGSHVDASYQERVNLAFRAMEPEFTRPLAACLTTDEVQLYGNNHKNAINGAAYVLGTYRREFSDTHGSRLAPPELVQRALDCAVFITRTLQACRRTSWEVS
ncbi:MAG: hypothetical protein EHM61_24080 [Acidobacteria bacterium]|nr:MAG: hypothetical protein EHM61_24080 [Acidobacteriota bacterium]